MIIFPQELKQFDIFEAIYANLKNSLKVSFSFLTFFYGFEDGWNYFDWIGCSLFIIATILRHIATWKQNENLFVTARCLITKQTKFLSY
jgi:hypothetical protein